MKTGMFLFITGLLLTLGGVGGIEHSITDDELISGVIASAVGLGIMYCGVLFLQREPGSSVDNPTLR
jgi:uncharacterized membrane protein